MIMAVAMEIEIERGKDKVRLSNLELTKKVGIMLKAYKQMH